MLKNRKSREILYAFNAAASSCHHASFLQHFNKDSFSFCSPQPLLRNFLLSFSPISFKNVQNVHQNLILIAETHVYTKPLTSKKGELFLRHTSANWLGVGIC